MYILIRDALINLGVVDWFIKPLSYTILIVVIVLLVIIVDFISMKILLTALKKIVISTKTNWDEKIYDRKVFHKLARIPSAMIIYIFAVGEYAETIRTIIYGYILLLVLLAILCLLNAVMDIYNSYELSKNRPIKGFIQVIKIFFYILFGIILLSRFTSPQTTIALLSTLGGMSAIILLVFNDSILGFVAGIQLTTDNMLKLGDWIEVPSHNIDGEVIDITLNKIKVQNWDKTISHMPAKEFINTSFKNWEGMSQAGGRRIKRAIYIDVNSIKFLSEEDIKKLSNIHYLKDYLHKKEVEIEEFNKLQDNKKSNINGRHLTNIGVFRAYIKAYLKNNKKIHQGYTMLVRQLSLSDKGLPIEIYAFTNDTRWGNYEDIQADIFDHLLAIIKEFELDIYQSPSSSDMRIIVGKN